MQYPASNIAIWNGEEVPCCTEHAKQLVALGQALGLNVPVYTYTGEQRECKNCVNDAKKSDNR